ncbi:DUF2971 domain-containing protein (plasmid) [Vibrio campbellii]|uniref:DUF2971 domain-containing protein n=1 Tax=Vibrio campbellii TaxID=680 RepID=A0ABY5IL70_9VIBR|nr:DUF2971 domain-containing protein [Vibrio campbellii]UTZ35036.1 DUF2971 domain-containing protein [Vibrio campbellii]UTZ35127.1 DUF2971 domain-containing protein [Vibrio campbellii]
MKLFKFRAANERDISALVNNQLYFSSYEQLNDPYEGWATYDSSKVNDKLRIKLLKSVFQENGYSNVDAERKAKEEYLRCLEQQSNISFSDHVDSQYEEKLVEYFNEHKDRNAVCSMSKGADVDFPEVLASMMMWSHYGNGFKGICLEFDAERLIESLRYNGSMIGTVHVEYPKDGNLPVINLHDYYCDIIDNTSHSSKSILQALSTKANCWAYEREFRLIADHGLHTYDISALNSIYIPMKTPRTIVEKILSYVSEQKVSINIYVVTLHKSSYKFGFKKIFPIS